MNVSPEQALLLACVHQDSQRVANVQLRSFDSPRWDKLVRLAARNRVRPLVHRRLKALGNERGVPDRILRWLARTVEATTQRNLTFQSELAELARALGPVGVDLLVLKGGHLITTVYDSVAMREMDDVDLLVRREQMGRAVEAVTARGYQPLKPFSLEADAALTYHLPRFMNSEVGIELHWSVTEHSDANAIDPAALWSRAVPITIGGASVLALCREDLLLHLCFHASYHHQFRFGLRPLCDVAAVIASEGANLDWRLIAQRSREWRWERGVYLTLRLAHELVGAETPMAALESMKPPDLEDAVLAAARAHVFADRRADKLHGRVARLAGSETLRDRLRFFGRRVVPTRRELAELYDLEPGSPRVVLSYFWRVRDLIVRHGGPAARLLIAKDPQLTDAARRMNLLRRWLES